jgi:hypothetical protein
MEAVVSSFEEGGALAYYDGLIRSRLRELPVDHVDLVERMGQIVPLRRLLSPTLGTIALFGPAFDLMPYNLAGQRILVLDESVGTGGRLGHIASTLRKRGALVSALALYRRPLSSEEKRRVEHPRETKGAEEDAPPVRVLLPEVGEETAKYLGAEYRQRVYERPHTFCVDHLDFKFVGVAIDEFLSFVRGVAAMGGLVEIPDAIPRSHRVAYTVFDAALPVDLFARIDHAPGVKLIFPNRKIRFYYEGENRTLRIFPLFYPELTIDEALLSKPVELLRNLGLPEALASLASHGPGDAGADPRFLARRIHHILSLWVMLRVGHYLASLSRNYGLPVPELDTESLRTSFGPMAAVNLSETWETMSGSKNSVESPRVLTDPSNPVRAYRTVMDVLDRVMKPVRSAHKSMAPPQLISIAEIRGACPELTAHEFALGLDLAIDLDMIRARTTARTEQGRVVVDRKFMCTEAGQDPPVVANPLLRARLRLLARMEAVCVVFNTRGHPQVGMVSMHKALVLPTQIPEWKAPEVGREPYHYGFLATLKGAGRAGRGIRAESIASESESFVREILPDKQGRDDRPMAPTQTVPATSDSPAVVVSPRGFKLSLPLTDEQLIVRSQATISFEELIAWKGQNAVAEILQGTVFRLRVSAGTIYNESTSAPWGSFPSMGVNIPAADYNSLVTVTCCPDEPSTYLCGWTNLREWCDSIALRVIEATQMKSDTTPAFPLARARTVLVWANDDLQQLGQKLTRYYSLEHLASELRHVVSGSRLPKIDDDARLRLRAVTNRLDPGKVTQRLRRLQEAFEGGQHFASLLDDLLAYDPARSRDSSYVDSVMHEVEPHLADLKARFQLTSRWDEIRLRDILASGDAGELARWIRGNIHFVGHLLVSRAPRPTDMLEFQDRLAIALQPAKSDVFIAAVERTGAPVTIVSMDKPLTSSQLIDLGPGPTKDLAAFADEIITDAACSHDSAVAPPFFEGNDHWLTAFRTPNDAIDFALHVYDTLRIRREEFPPPQIHMRTGIAQSSIDVKYGLALGPALAEAVILREAKQGGPLATASIHPVPLDHIVLSRTVATQVSGLLERRNISTEDFEVQGHPGIRAFRLKQPVGPVPDVGAR